MDALSIVSSVTGRRSVSNETDQYRLAFSVVPTVVPIARRGEFDPEEPPMMVAFMRPQAR